MVRTALIALTGLILTTNAFAQGIPLVEPVVNSTPVSLVELLANSPASEDFEVGRFIDQGSRTGIPYANATAMPEGVPMAFEFDTQRDSLKAVVRPDGLESFLNKPVRAFYFFGLTRPYKTLRAQVRLDDPGMTAENAHIRVELNGAVLNDVPLIPNQTTELLVTIPEYTRNQNHLVVLGEMRFLKAPANPVTLSLDNPEFLP